MSIEDGLKDSENTPITPLDLDKFRHIKWHWWEYPEIWCRRTWAFLEDIPREIRWFIQRGKRGYSDRDIWGFHYHISDVIYHGLLHLKKCKHGTPSTLDPVTGEYSYDEKRWDETLDQMIKGFELAYKVSNGDLEYAENMSEPDKIKMEIDMHQAYPEFRFLTWEEEMSMGMGFYLFSKYFFNLWD